MSLATQPRWGAAEGCPDHLRDLIERTVNAYPPGATAMPRTGEVFTSIDECRDRLITYAFSQGFNVVTTNSQKARGIATFSCIHHGVESRNTRGLPRNIKRNEIGQIIGER